MPEQEVVIGQANEADARGIFAVQKKMCIATYTGINGISEETLEQHFAAYQRILITDIRSNIRLGIRNPEESVYFVGRVGDRVVGYSGACVDKGTRRMNGLYVDTAYQGRGLGRELMQRALDWQKPGFDIYLSVVEGTRAEQFHTSFGFQPTGVREDIVLFDRTSILPNIQMKLLAQNRGRAIPG